MFIFDHKLKKSIISSAFLLSALAITACGANEATEKVEAKVDSTVKAIKTTASVAVSKSPAATATASATLTYANGKRVIDGGAVYPVKDGKAGPYHVNTQDMKDFKYGRKPTENEIKAWDIDVMPDGTGLPEGSGSVEDGDEIYEAQCTSCHGDFGTGGGGYPALSKGNAAEGFATLKNQRVNPDDDGPVRVFGSYWPEASTLWWYIKTGMPHNAPLSLSDDDVYALCAYILMINEISIDGVELDDEYVLDREKFMKIVMPNKDGFVPKIDGPKGTDNIRDFLSDTKNYGNGTRCMKDCTDKANVVHIKMEMNEMLPPMSVARDLPKVDPKASAAAVPGQKSYEESCALCHATDAMGAPVVGNKADWDKVMKQGIDTVYEHAIKGFNGMPAKGGKASLSDDEVKEIVDYMLGASK